jgi:hypothetical protein
LHISGVIRKELSACFKPQQANNAKAIIDQDLINDKHNLARKSHREPLGQHIKQL